MTTPTDERRPDPADLPVLRRRPTTGTTPHAALLGLVPQLPDPSDHSPMVETVPETVDYRQVIVLRRRVSEELNRRVDDQVNRVAAQRGLDPRRDRELLELSAEEEQELTREVILEVIDAADADSTNRGDGAFTLPYRQVLAKTLYDAIHGLGPLQPLLDDPTIQNIVIASGYDRMFIYRDDGSIEKIPRFSPATRTSSPTSPAWPPKVRAATRAPSHPPSPSSTSAFRTAPASPQSTGSRRHHRS
jgi:hypothetical protein